MRKVIVVLGLAGVFAAGAITVGQSREQHELEMLRGSDAPPNAMCIEVRSQKSKVRS